jgi:hypothetical protein
LNSAGQKQHAPQNRFHPYTPGIIPAFFQDNLDIVLPGDVPRFPGYKQHFAFLVKIPGKKAIGSEKSFCGVEFPVIAEKNPMRSKPFFPVRHEALKAAFLGLLIGRVA